MFHSQMQILYIWASNAASILIIFSRHRKLLLVDLYIWRRFQTQTLMRVISPSVKKNPSLCDTSRKFGVCRNTPPVGYMTAAHLDHSLSWGVMLHAPSFTSVAWYFLRCLFKFHSKYHDRRTFARESKRMNEAQLTAVCPRRANVTSLWV